MNPQIKSPQKYFLSIKYFGINLNQEAVRAANETIKSEQTPAGYSGGQRSLGMLQSMESQRVGHSLATEQHPKYIWN